MFTRAGINKALEFISSPTNRNPYIAVKLVIDIKYEIFFLVIPNIEKINSSTNNKPEINRSTDRPIASKYNDPKNMSNRANADIILNCVFVSFEFDIIDSVYRYSNR